MWCKKHFDILNRLGVDYECDWRTDRQTDRTAITIACLPTCAKTRLTVFARNLHIKIEFRFTFLCLLQAGHYKQTQYGLLLRDWPPDNWTSRRMLLFRVASQAGQPRNVVGSERALHDVNISEERRRGKRRRGLTMGAWWWRVWWRSMTAIAIVFTRHGDASCQQPDGHRRVTVNREIRVRESRGTWTSDEPSCTSIHSSQIADITRHSHTGFDITLVGL